MQEGTKFFIGLDVHKESVAIAVAGAGREAPRFIGTTQADLNQVRRALDRVGTADEMLVVYEAGPSGYVLARDLAARGYWCEVVAPSKIARPAGDRVKTDRRDAILLARLSRAGELVRVTVPDARDEAMRDLSRAREDAVGARLKARLQLKAMLLRHGRSYPGKVGWSAAHERYLATIGFEHAAQDIAFAEYRRAVTDADERVARLTQALRDQATAWRMRPVVEALMTLRGIDSVAAVTLVAELGDLSRFARAQELMAFLGLVPCEHTSGDKRRQGAITKAGNGHARRMLVEAAWNYRFPARMSRGLQTRQAGRPKDVRDIAWRAQLRLCARYRRLKARGLHQNKICVAIARELSGFIWDLARHVEVTA